MDEATLTFCSTIDSSLLPSLLIFNETTVSFPRFLFLLLTSRCQKYDYLPIITEKNTVGVQHWHYLEDDVISQDLGDGVGANKKVH